MLLLEDLERITIHVTNLFLNAASEKKRKKKAHSLVFKAIGWLRKNKSKQPTTKTYCEIYFGKSKLQSDVLGSSILN